MELVCVNLVIELLVNSFEFIYFCKRQDNRNQNHSFSLMHFFVLVVIFGINIISDNLSNYQLKFGTRGYYYLELETCLFGFFSLEWNWSALFQLF